jgi:hypothetical protein
MVALLLASNVVLFVFYQEANPDLRFSQQVIGYLQTNMFTVVTATTFLPILLALADQIFRIGETAEQRIHDREQAQAEQRRSAIEQLSATWNDLYSTCNEVVFFDPEAGSRSRIRETWHKLAAVTGTGNVAFNAIITRFFKPAEISKPSAGSGFSLKDVEVFIRFFNVSIASGKAVASFIDDPSPHNTAAEIRDLQSSLGVILEGTKRLGQQRMLVVLKYSDELLSSESAERKADLRDEISHYMDELKEVSEGIRALENASNRVLPGIGGHDADGVRSAAARFREWRQSNPDKPPEKSEEFSNLVNSLGPLPHQKRVEGLRTAYSPDFVRTLADYLFPYIVVESLTDDIPPQF